MILHHLKFNKTQSCFVIGALISRLKTSHCGLLPLLGSLYSCRSTRCTDLLFTVAPHFFFHRKKNLHHSLPSPDPTQPAFLSCPACKRRQGQTYQQLPLLTAGGAPGAVLPASHTSFCLIPVTTPRKPSPFQRDKIAHLALRTSTSLLYFFSTWRLSLNAEQRWPWRKGEMCPFSKPTRQGRANAYTLQESALRLNITIGTVPPQNGRLRKQQGPPSTAHVRSGEPSAKTNLKEILILGKMDLD